MYTYHTAWVALLWLRTPSLPFFYLCYLKFVKMPIYLYDLNCMYIYLPRYMRFDLKFGKSGGKNRALRWVDLWFDSVPVVHAWALQCRFALSTRVSYNTMVVL